MLSSEWLSTEAAFQHHSWWQGPCAMPLLGLMCDFSCMVYILVLMCAHCVCVLVQVLHYVILLQLCHRLLCASACSPF